MTGSVRQEDGSCLDLMLGAGRKIRGSAECWQSRQIQASVGVTRLLPSGA